MWSVYLLLSLLMCHTSQEAYLTKNSLLQKCTKKCKIRSTCQKRRGRWGSWGEPTSPPSPQSRPCLSRPPSFYMDDHWWLEMLAFAPKTITVEMRKAKERVAWQLVEESQEWKKNLMHSTRLGTTSSLQAWQRRPTFESDLYFFSFCKIKSSEETNLYTINNCHAALGTAQHWLALVWKTSENCGESESERMKSDRSRHLHLQYRPMQQF